METSTPSGNRTRRTAILIVAVAFIAGALIGVAGGRAWSLLRGPIPHRPDFVRGRIVEHLDESLQLTPQQREQVEKIMERHHQRMREISEGMRPRMRQEIDAANREVESLLTPEQRKKFEKMKMRMRFGQRPGGRRRGNGPPPPHDGHPPPGF
jgi:Spy/CpxP family protein refolding chaperone